MRFCREAPSSALAHSRSFVNAACPALIMDQSTQVPNLAPPGVVTVWVPQFPHLYNGDGNCNYRVGADSTLGHPRCWAWRFPHAPFLLGILPVVCPRPT